MKRLILSFALIGGMAGSTLAQPPQGELRAYYQRLGSFEFRSGSPQFDIMDKSFNGGGFGFVMNLKDWLGFFTETNFLGGVEQGTIRLSLINQIQGVKLTAREIRSPNLYAKGGIGFTRFVFAIGGQDTVRYQTSFIAGGGVDFMFNEGMAIFSKELWFRCPCPT
jgi:hypothetical protein